MNSNKLTILVVDDQPMMLEILVQTLQEHYDLSVAINGGKALQMALSANPPDLILLDIMMDDLDGYEVCRRLKSDHRTRDIPVIFISALDEAFDKVKAFSIGGVDYVTKPFDVEEVLARVKTHLTLRTVQKRLEEQNDLFQAEIVARKKAQEELEAALSEVKRLSGLLPICASCKKIRDDKGYWQQIEAYIRDHSEADFSHGICPDCARRLYPGIIKEDSE